MPLVRRFIHKVVSAPYIYDLIQKIAGANYLASELDHLISQIQKGETILDIGAGTALHRQAIPAFANYIWLDMDPLKYKGASKKILESDDAILADATKIPLADHCVDYAFCSSLSHHLSDGQLYEFFVGVHRITRKKFFFIDAVRDDHSYLRKLAWAYDRGSKPRHQKRIEEFIATKFEIISKRNLELFHRIFIWELIPK